MKRCHSLNPIILSWIVLSCYICRPVSGVHCFRREKEALLHFKHGITEDYCGLLDSWGRDPDCCQWRGVLCSNHTGHVISLRLGEGNADNYGCLDGKVNPYLSELKHLRHLDLSSNYFFQPVPRFLGSLSNLEYLSLSDAGFEGEIPHQIGNLTKLTTLDLSGNTCSGKNLSWLSRLNLLTYLDLSGADLSEATNWLQIVNSLPLISVLRMDGCQLSVKNSSSLTYGNSSVTLQIISLSENYFQDTSIFQWLFSLPEITSQLVYLDLSANILQCPIPDGFRHMQHLSHLSLSNNYLEGPISSEFWNMSSLTYLSVSDNNLRGSVFKLCSKLCNLRRLYLAGNNLTDELSNVIQIVSGCANQGLLTMDLSNNRISGSIPDTISSFSSLRELYLQISNGIGQLSKLERLDISSNSLQGSLTSEHFSNLSSLREFSSSDNLKLMVNISGNWYPPFQLDTLDLGRCNMSLGFPKWLRTQKNLSFLDISSAEISDDVPDSFWNSLSPNLQHLNMSRNQIYGEITNFSVVFNGLFELDLSSNLFEGAVPFGFTNVYSSLYLNDNRFTNSNNILCPETTSVLSELDLSNNLLSGELHDHCWMNLNLLSLHLENNRFSGNIPKSIGSMDQLNYLHLHNNSFSGHLPASLQSCSSLVILSLGYNSFTGKIPPWIGHAFPKLGALSLRSNNFSRKIPLRICRLSYLQILDLSVNNISGVIPQCIHNLTAMGRKTDSTLGFATVSSDVNHQPILIDRETAIVTWKKQEQRFKNSVGLVKSIDLSYNDLHGEIPSGIVSLTGLVSLDLSGNRLSGSIPSEIGNLTALELLDFSDNHLSGGIPASLTKLSALEILGLSNNNLSGDIPLSTQLQSFNASSYTGNPGLCGAPLPKCSRDHQAPGVNSTPNVEDEHDEYGVFPGLYISVILGFIVGFWGVCGTLIIKQSWRHAYFRVLHDIHDKFSEIAIKIAGKTRRNS